jgi:hypothetical protein
MAYQLLLVKLRILLASFSRKEPSDASVTETWTNEK